MEDISEQIQDIQERLDGLASELNDLSYELENIEIPEIDSKNSISDVNLFKEKLELYGLRTEELWNFIDDYLRLYNK